MRLAYTNATVFRVEKLVAASLTVMVLPGVAEFPETENEVSVGVSARAAWASGSICRSIRAVGWTPVHGWLRDL
jgi:hypothetical protein